MKISTAVGPLTTNVRFELKTAISENVAERIRNAIAFWMKPDLHGNSVTGKYDLHTVYLNSQELAAHQNFLNRAARFKLRMRFYDDHPASPVFVEVKRARAGRAATSRFAVDRTMASSVFPCSVGQTLTTDDLGLEFWQAVSQFSARPTIHIAQEREAFIDRDDPNVRLTMDRSVRFEPMPKALSTSLHSPIAMWFDRVLLEVKFTDTMPAYLNEVVRTIGLQTPKTRGSSRRARKPVNLRASSADASGAPEESNCSGRAIEAHLNVDSVMTSLREVSRVRGSRISSRGLLPSGKRKTPSCL